MRKLLIAALYGLIQGLTEWLPVSSTGHMLLLDAAIPLPVSTDFRPFFLVAIQLGSLLALLPRFLRLRDARFWGRVLCASIPAALLGFALDDFLDATLSSPTVIACALIGYGVVFVLIGRRSGDILRPGDISLGRAIGVGCFQALALIPGTSRSGATILGGTLLGLSPACAAELSFALSAPTMLGATGLRGLKLLDAGIAAQPGDWTMLILAGAVAFAVSRAASSFLVEFVHRRGLAPFGIYRLLVGALVLIAL